MAKLICVKVNQLFGMLLKSTKKWLTTSFQKITCKDLKWEFSSINSQRSSHPSNQDISTGQRKLNNKKKNKDKKSWNSLKSWMKSWSFLMLLDSNLLLLIFSFTLIWNFGMHWNILQDWKFTRISIKFKNILPTFNKESQSKDTFNPKKSTLKLYKNSFDLKIIYLFNKSFKLFIIYFEIIFE